MTTVERPDYKIIGTSPIRPDGAEKVTGAARYAADFKPAGLLYGAILRSPHAHARVIKIDTSEAAKMPGVMAVATHTDLPAAADKVEAIGESAVNLKELSSNILAHDKVLYHGHAVAAVAARSHFEAEAAARAIKVEYELLPPVLDVRDAMREDAPLLDENRHTKVMGGQTSDKPSNIASHNRFEDGDVEKALAESDHVVDREYRTRMVHQGYIEPHSSTAMWNSDDTIQIYTSTQGAFGVRSLTSQVLAVPLSSIRVTPLEIGGGFGGKTVIYLDPVAAVLSRKTGKPVKISMNRTDVFEATGPTSGS
ncbi:MAG: xanthine dehydrogenase family protein molybdopterin-binding subunit, partial [Dehalococcoidia bacterium]|nr:xanthine dehydrogenase family protein molybdopterin-binding subunit [Dehalococcoidia bacterium]